MIRIDASVGTDDLDDVEVDRITAVVKVIDNLNTISIFLNLSQMIGRTDVGCSDGERAHCYHLLSFFLESLLFVE